MEKKDSLKVSLCITVFNEEKHIGRLLESIAHQTRTPDEVVIVDGGSTDETVGGITNYELRIKNLKILTKKGNRAVGRNEAIVQAKGNIIAITDAGCELDSHWLEALIKPFTDPKTHVVSGYYAGKPKNVFEKSLVPYVLVMPDRVNPSLFLPSTRSMAMKKSVWEQMGGFPEAYRWNEDYVFSKQLVENNIPIVFAQKAIVYWFPRETFWGAWKMFYAFAKGDAQSRIFRPKVLFLFLRYIIGLYLLYTAFWLAVVWFAVYLVWAVIKNYKYVGNLQAIIYLPLLQLCADSAVMAGTIKGSIETW